MSCSPDSQVKFLIISLNNNNNNNNNNNIKLWCLRPHGRSENFYGNNRGIFKASQRDISLTEHRNTAHSHEQQIDYFKGITLTRLIPQ